MKNTIYSVLLIGGILLAGCQSKDGSPGPSGSNGVNGQQGTQGDQGPQGVPGPQGQQGAQGPQGSQGSQGSQGAAGANGSNGQNANVKVFYFTVGAEEWAGTVGATVTDTVMWAKSISNAAFTQGAKDSALVAVFKKGSDNVSAGLPIYDGMMQELFKLPSGNTNLDLSIKKQDNSNVARPGAAQYRVVLAYPSFVRVNPNIDWRSERSVMAAISSN